MKRCLLILFAFITIVATAQVRQYTTPVVNSIVTHIDRYQNNLFLCGDFTQLGTDSVPYLAMLYADTGTLQSWRPAPDGQVNVILVQNGKLIVGGDFTHIAGQSRHYLAIFDAATGALLPAAPACSNVVNALWADGNSIYFDGFRGNATVIQNFDLTTGAISGWSSDPIDVGGAINAIAKAGNYIYVGGQHIQSYTHYNINTLFRFSAVSGQLDTTFVMSTDPFSWVSQILPYQGQIYVCGSFDSLGHIITPGGFIAFDSLGAPTNFNFYPSGSQTFAMFPQGNTLWVGGNSYSMGFSSNSPYLAQIYIPTATATCWEHPLSDNWLITDAIYVSNDTVYAGAYGVVNNGFHMYTGSPYFNITGSVSIATVNGYPVVGMDSIVATTTMAAYSYQWYIDGYPVYNHNQPRLGLYGGSNGDTLSLVVQYQICNGSISIFDTSNTIYFSITPPPPPPLAVYLNNYYLDICQGENDVILSPGINRNYNSQITYQYRWYRNNVFTGDTLESYNPQNIQNGDSIWVSVADSAEIAISNILHITTFQMADLYLTTSGNCNTPDTITLNGYPSSFPIYWVKNTALVDTSDLYLTVCQAIVYNYWNNDGFTVDKYGAVYLSDSNRVTKWNPGDTMGIVVAGDLLGTPGIGAGHLNHPTGIFIDNNRSLYICDALNYRVQRWDYGATQGITVAGGNGGGNAASQFDGMMDIFVDQHSNMYISDLNNHRVQKWTSGAITGTTVAGGHGPGNTYPYQNYELAQPWGVTADDSGNVYVSDTYWNLVLKWPPGDSTATILPVGNVFSPTGLRWDNSGSLLIADYGESKIVKFHLGDTLSSTLIGQEPFSFSQQLGFPLDVYIDSMGNTYILETDGFSLYQVTKCPKLDTSIITDQPGNYRAIIKYSYGCIDTSSSVYIAKPVTSSFSQSICQGDNYLFRGDTITRPGDYTDTLAASTGCDSIVTLHLSFYNTQPLIVSGGSSLLCNTPGTHYQWLLNGTPITGDTMNSIVATINGTYSIVVTTINGCMLTSDTLQVTTTSVATSLSDAISLYPNPATESCTISILNSRGETYSMELVDIMGKEVYRDSFKSTGYTFSVATYAKGIYQLIISANDGQPTVKKLVLE